jgi:hypothetical protein
MRSLRSWIALLSSGWVCSQASAADFYVAPTGSDTNAGTLAQPFASVERAESAAAPGDTVYLRGGVYRFSGTQKTVGVAFSKSGSQDKPIHYVAYTGEVPIFDLFELKPQARVTGLDVRCNWIHLRGLEVRGVRQLIVGDSWSVRIRGDHNVLEQLHVHDGEAPGIFITSGAHNLVLNCDSHHNYDPLEQGGNADGFGCHSTGGDNVLRGCRAWENSDDGYDFINAAGPCIAEGSWAFRNGFIPDTTTVVGNGAGFKSGGFGVPPNVPATGAPRHVVRGNLAFGNLIGIYANYHPGGIDFLNNTAFDNPANFDMRTAGGTSSHKLRNNVAAGTGKTIVSLNGGTDTSNSWTLPVQVSSADFLSLDKALATAPRQADGSLPRVNLARLAQGSDLIDRGEDVGLPFQGSAPDLGAYELGLDTSLPPIDAGVAEAGTSATDSGASTAGGDSGSNATARDAGASTGADAAMSPARPDAATSSPTSLADAAAQADAAASPDAQAHAPTSGGPADEDVDAHSDSGGCSIQSAGSRSPLALAALAAVCMLAWLHRRRE